MIGIATTAGQGKGLPFLDKLTRLDQEGCVVAVCGGQSIAVVEDDGVPTLEIESRAQHGTGGARPHEATVRGSDQDAALIR